MRLIDADELNLAFDFDDDVELEVAVVHYGINHAPTVDAVPVVRCKDCKHKYQHEGAWLCRFGVLMQGENGYCSYGEKVTE